MRDLGPQGRLSASLIRFSSSRGTLSPTFDQWKDARGAVEACSIAQAHDCVGPG